MDVAHQIDRELHLAQGEACHRLIEQQHLGLRCQRACDFQPFAAGRPKRPRRRIGEPGHADPLEYGARACFGLGAMRAAEKRQAGNDDVRLEHQHILGSTR